MTHIAPEIFKAYDIRGIVGQSLTPETAMLIGQAIGTRALERGAVSIVVGRDGRLSGPEMQVALTDGITSTGLDVIDIGRAPTPVVYFAAQHFSAHCCVAITGSHNPPNYNGFKIVLGGETQSGAAIRSLHRIASERRFREGRGILRKGDIREDYLQRIVSDVRLARPMKIAIDCGNGIAGAYAPELFTRMGCEVIPLYCTVDGRFPNHHPDPSQPENLEDLRRALRETDAEVGLAFDGDGDRLGVVTRDGEIIYPDRQLMLFAADVLTRNPGAEIIYDVKCSRLVAASIRHQGGKPLMWKTGHALIKAKMKETGAPLAGEMSGHMFFRERWFGFDDGLYAGARLLEIISRWDDACWPLRNLPDAIATPELNLAMREGEPHQLIDKLAREGKFPAARDIITLDGVRVEYDDGFGLARASNTTPVVVMRFEADNTAALDRIRADFRAAIIAVWPAAAVLFQEMQKS